MDPFTMGLPAGTPPVDPFAWALAQSQGSADPYDDALDPHALAAQRLAAQRAALLAAVLGGMHGGQVATTGTLGAHPLPMRRPHAGIMPARVRGGGAAIRAAILHLLHPAAAAAGDGFVQVHDTNPWRRLPPHPAHADGFQLIG